MAYKERQPVILVKNSFNPAVLVFAAAAGIFGYWLYRKSVPITADFTDPDYMRNNPEYPETYYSTDDDGGTVFYELDMNRPISRGGPARPVGPNRRSEERISDQGYANYPVPTGGTFVNPGVLPPVKTAQIQAGRFIHPEILPATVIYHLQ